MIELHDTPASLPDCKKLSSRSKLALFFEERKDGPVQYGTGCWLHNEAEKDQELTILLKRNGQEASIQKVSDRYFSIELEGDVTEQSKSLIAKYTKKPPTDDSGFITVLLGSSSTPRCKVGEKAATVIRTSSSGRRTVDSNGCWFVEVEAVHYESHVTQDRRPKVIFSIPTSEFVTTNAFKKWK